MNRIAAVKSAAAHIDEKYGIDVDEVYRVEDALSSHTAARYSIFLGDSTGQAPDDIHLGYLRLDRV